MPRQRNIEVPFTKEEKHGAFIPLKEARSKRNPSKFDFDLDKHTLLMLECDKLIQEINLGIAKINKILHPHDFDLDVAVARIKEYADRTNPEYIRMLRGRK